MTDIVFLDIETLGLDPAAPIWEFAALRRYADGTDERITFTIQHSPAAAKLWLPTLREKFQIDYRNRFDPAEAISQDSAASLINIYTRGAVMICCNPLFDEPRLAELLRSHFIEPGWHYHALDTSSLVIGYLAGRGYPPHPSAWKSDVLSGTIGIDPDDYDRHTAMGDTQWIADQWDIVMGGVNA